MPEEPSFRYSGLFIIKFESPTLSLRKVAKSLKPNSYAFPFSLFRVLLVAPVGTFFNFSILLILILLLIPFFSWFLFLFSNFFFFYLSSRNSRNFPSSDLLLLHLLLSTWLIVFYVLHTARLHHDCGSLRRRLNFLPAFGDRGPTSPTISCFVSLAVHQ